MYERSSAALCFDLHESWSQPKLFFLFQDQNGHLTATHVTRLPPGAIPQEIAPLPAQDLALVQQMPSGHVPGAEVQAQQLMHQLSQQSDGSSVVNPDYGPYSQAAAVTKALQQFQQQQLEHSMALSQLQQNTNLHLHQQDNSNPPNPPTSQPPRSFIPRANDMELQEMPGQSFFTHQHPHQNPLNQQLEYHPEQQQQPPQPFDASQYLFRALSPPQYNQQQQQTHQHKHQGSEPQPVTPRRGSQLSHPSTPNIKRAANPEEIPLTHTPSSEIRTQTFSNPVMTTVASSDSEGYIDTAIGSSLSASPGVGLEAPVDLHFQPALSHDPRPPNDIYLESIDLSSTLPEVAAISPASRRRGQSNRPEHLTLAPASDV